jgi:hypothetical protein
VVSASDAAASVFTPGSVDSPPQEIMADARSASAMKVDAMRAFFVMVNSLFIWNIGCFFARIDFAFSAS